MHHPSNDEPTFVRPLPGTSVRTAGAVLGGAAGFVLGAIIGPEGMAAGLFLGAIVGAVAGSVIAKEERKGDRRTRELDAMIGITEGSLGAPPDSLVPPPQEPRDEGWGSEWLTPPPPAAAAR